MAHWNTAWDATAASSDHNLTEKGLASLQHLVPLSLHQARGWGWQLLPTPQSCPGDNVLSGLNAEALLTPSCLASGMRKRQSPASEEGTGGLQPPQASESADTAVAVAQERA